MANIWFAKNAVVKIDLSSNVTITGAAALDTFFSGGSAITGQMKDISITEPKGDMDKIDLLGTDASGYQNAEAEEKPAVNGEVSGTLILDGDEVLESFFYDAGSAVAGTHTRYSPGLATVRKISMLLNLDDGTDEVNIALDNAYPTAKDMKVTGADGHFEITFTAKCLPRDFYGPEFKD